MSKTNYYAKAKSKLSSLMSVKTNTQEVPIPVVKEIPASELKKRLDSLSEQFTRLETTHAAVLVENKKLTEANNQQKSTIQRLFNENREIDSKYQDLLDYVPSMARNIPQIQPGRYSCRKRTFVEDETGGYYTPWESWYRITKQEYDAGILCGDENGTVQYKFQGG